MALPSGQISFGQVNTELALSATAQISLNDTAVRSLAGVSSGQISMSNLQGKSSLPAIGAAYQGGFFAGQVNQGGTIYNLIVAPVSSGQILGKKYNTSYGGTSANSMIDGPANTAAAVAVGASQEAATWTASLSIGGYTDWYIPATNEWITMLYFLKPSTRPNYTSPNKSNPNAVAPQPTGTNWTTTVPARTTATDFIFINSYDGGNGANCLVNLPGGPYYGFWTSTNVGTYSVHSFDTGAIGNYCGYYNDQAKPNGSTITRAMRRVAA